MISAIVQVANDGTVKIPPEIWQEAGVTPPGDVKVEAKAREITLIPHRAPAPMTDEDRAQFDRVARLLRESFAGSNASAAWSEIHSNRRDQ